jgi:hypothetical protein
MSPWALVWVAAGALAVAAAVLIILTRREAAAR